MASEVMVVTAPVEVHVPGNVLYTSDNAQILAADDVYASGKSDDGSEEKSFEEKAADKRFYIIFDMEE